MPDCLASYQSVTRMKRKADARTSLVREQKEDQSRTRMHAPVSDSDDESWNADAGSICLDAITQQWQKIMNVKKWKLAHITVRGAKVFLLLHKT